MIDTLKQDISIEVSNVIVNDQARIVDYLDHQTTLFIEDMTGIPSNRLYGLKSGRVKLSALKFSEYLSFMCLIDKTTKPDGSYRIFRKDHYGRFLGKGIWIEVEQCEAEQLEVSQDEH